MKTVGWRSGCAVIIALTLLPDGAVQAADLMTVYRLASESSPMVARAEARWQAEQFGDDIARSSLTPRLTAEGTVSLDKLDLTGFGTTAIDETYTPSGFSVTLTQPLINGTAWSALKASRSNTQSYKSALLAVQQDLILQTADAYFSVLRAEALERTVLSRQTLLQKISDRAEREHQAGTGDKIAVEEAQARLDGIRAERLSARNKVQIARRALERLTHQPSDTLADLNTLEPQGPIPDRMEDWVQSAENNQPVLEQARQDVQARRYRVDAESRGNWPVISLNAQYIYGDGVFMPDLERRESLIGISAVWPLFQGGAVRASKARAKALARAGQYGLEDLEDNVRLDTQRSFLNLENSAAQLTAARQALESATTALSATQKGYDIGSRSVVELLDSEQRHANAESDYYQSLYNQVLARMQLKASAGVLSENDVAAINALLTSATETGSEQ
jgi:outer membrane protein